MNRPPLFENALPMVEVRAAKISSKDPATMTPAQINKERKKIDELGGKVTDEMIAVGRGNERYNETHAKAMARDPDTLTAEWWRIEKRRLELRGEVHRRAGPRFLGDLQRIHKKRK